MSDTEIEVRMNLPREALQAERAAAGAGYQLGTETPLPPDPDAVEARFIDPVTLIVTGTAAMIAWRIVTHLLARDGRGVLIDMRATPPVVSRLEDVQEGFVVLVRADGSSETIATAKTDDSAIATLIQQALSQGA